MPPSLEQFGRITSLGLFVLICCDKSATSSRASGTRPIFRLPRCLLTWPGRISGVDAHLCLTAALRRPLYLCRSLTFHGLLSRRAAAVELLFRFHVADRSH